MNKGTLAEVDQIYGHQDLPWVVQAWKGEDTGVDPLGLRQINLNMMDRLIPGINNVTRHVRVYTLMTWAWWQAGRVLSNNSERGIWSRDMREFVERVDAIFSWSQFLRDPKATLPGRTVLPRELNSQTDKVAYDFAKKGWDTFRKSRRNSTDLLGALQYGPSIRGVDGLRWLEARDGVFVPTKDVMPAIEAFNAMVARHLPRCLKEPRWTILTHKELKTVGQAWHYQTPTEQERKVFKERFYGNPELGQKEVQLGRRRSTLSLMVEVLKSARAPCSVEDVRARMFGVGAPPSRDPAVERARKGWRVLQIRQLQRLAIEALYIAIEARLKADGSAATADIVGVLQDALADADIGSKGTTDEMLADGLAAWVANPEQAVFDLMKELEETQRSDPTAVPPLSIAAIACAHLLATNALKDEDSAEFMRDFDREADRLPLGVMLQRLTELGKRPATEALSEFVEAWVFGQHLRWSLVRSGDGQQRLRVALDEGGWTLLRADQSAVFRATPDRLLSALRLCADTGLITTVGPDVWVVTSKS